MTTLDHKEMGNRIKRERQRQGRTQQQMSEILDISLNHYSRIENGHTGISMDMLIRICGILELSPNYVLTGQIENSEKNPFVSEYNGLTQKQKDFVNKIISLLKSSKLE